MPIIYGAIVPHSPVFLPFFDKTAQEKVADTIQSLNRIRSNLQTLQPETILVIAPHDESKQRGEQYMFHVPSMYRVNFAEFGDLITKTEYQPDTVLATQLKDKFTSENIGVTYISEEKLDYSAGVPLEHIAKGLPAKILCIHPPGTEFESLFHDGLQIQKILQESPKRIVCIASADLAHCLTQEAPLPYNPLGLELDTNVMKWIKGKKTKNFFGISRALVEDIGSCGIPSIVLLMGIFKSLKHDVTPLSYENAIGVGHAVIEYTIS